MVTLTEQEKEEKYKGKSKEDMTDYEMGGPEADESDQVCCRFRGSSKSTLMRRFSSRWERQDQ